MPPYREALVFPYSRTRPNCTSSDSGALPSRHAAFFRRSSESRARFTIISSWSEAMTLDPVRVNRNGKIACTARAKLVAIMRKPNPEACRR
jgi:hypothetical protein